MKFKSAILILVLFSSCTNQPKPDLERLYNYISYDNLFNHENIELGNQLFPNRYHKSYASYANLHYQISSIISQVNGLKELSYTSYLQQKESLEIKLRTLIDSTQKINEKDSTLLISFNIKSPNDSICARSYIDNLLIESNKKLLTVTKKTYKENLDFFKLYLVLLDRDLLYTLNRSISSRTFPVDFIEPVIIKKSNSVTCYITSVDSEAKNFIIIGKFTQVPYNGNIYYKLIQPYDTIILDKAKADISNEVFNKGEAVLFMTLPDGSILQRKIK